MIALLCALKVELSSLQRLMRLRAVESGPARRLYCGRHRGADILLAQTGAGKERAEEATEHLLGQYPVSTVVSMGFAGALAEHLDVGNVVVCATLHCDASAACAPRPADHRSDDRLVRLAVGVLRDIPVRSCVGSGVTTSRPICTVAERQVLREASGADVVDMESFWIASTASRRGIPFVEIRAISDTKRDVLPPFDRWIASDGNVRLGDASNYLVRHPRHIVALLRLAANARRARANLTSVVSDLTIAIGEEICAHS